MDQRLKDCILKLYEIEAIKFGSFTLKSGALSPIYIDLRVTISFPKVLKMMTDLLWEKVKDLKIDLISGVPYGAIPFATILAYEHEIPMLLQRKEAKAHGTKKLVEGVYKKGQRCLLIEDVITSGMSIFETIPPLNEVGVEVKDVAVFLDRQKGGKEKLEKEGIRFHAAFTLTDLLNVLERSNKITKELVVEILK